MGNPVVHWEIAGKDGAKLREFYGSLFDWDIQVQAEMGDYGMVQESKGGIGGGIFQSPEGMPAYVTFYVQSDDLQASLNKAEELGGKTAVPPMPIPGVGSVAMFSDPEGNTVGLFKGE